jgi:hypothetical protein
MREAVFVLSVGMCLGLAACAGPGGMRPDSVSESKTSINSIDIDTNKVATVNRWAMDHGARLIWLNYPTKHQVGDGSQSN